MEDLFKSFSTFCKIAQYDKIVFWAIPVCTLIIIWLITTVGLKFFTKRKKLKTVFMVHKLWIYSSVITATTIIGLICYWWSVNYFSKNPLQLSILISLFISLLIPILSFVSLRRFFSNENLKGITNQPKTPNQLEESISYSKKAFRKNKLCYLLIPIGFLFLLFSLNKGENLISIVFDNSGSMANKNAIEAISETFDNLDNNNQIVFTTLEGLIEDKSTGKSSINDILATKNYTQLQAGNVVFFDDPKSAKNGLNQISNECYGSPISESIWKSFLYIKETLQNNSYKKKLLIIITDGDDIVGPTIPTGKFFFDDESFSDYFPSDKVFIIDYSEGITHPLLQKFQNAGCESYNVTNNKQDYINALDSALNSFKNNWNLIYWTIIFTVLMSIVALLIEPKKIV